MDLEQAVGIATQAGLLFVWCIAVLLASKAYLRMTRGMATGNGTDVTSKIRRSFLTFAFVFMPVLILWLPAFGILRPTDPIFVPAALTWLVLLVFGGLQFHLNLVPLKAGMAGSFGPGNNEAFGKRSSSNGLSTSEPRRNV